MSLSTFCSQKTLHLHFMTGPRGGAVGWGTALQAGRSRVRVPMVSLEFFIDIILPALGLSQPLPGIFPGVKAAGAWGWQLHHLHVPTVVKSGNLNLLEPSGPVQACNWIALPFYILWLQKSADYITFQWHVLYIICFLVWHRQDGCSSDRNMCVNSHTW
jgi:hypothetical protein